MYGDPASWHRLAGMLADVVADYLRAQVEAGAQALQLFDSWVGALDEADYREYVLPHVRRIFDALADLGVPTIHFGTGTGHLLVAQREAGGSVIGVDWRTPLDEARRRLGRRRRAPGQPRPDAALRAAGTPAARASTTSLRRASGRPGHVFNLGHGILPGTPMDAVAAVVERVTASGRS